MKWTKKDKLACEYMRGWADGKRYAEGKEKIRKALPRKFIGTFIDRPNGFCEGYAPLGSGPFLFGIESSIKHEALKEGKRK